MTEMIYSDDAERHVEWTVVGVLDLPSGRAVVWQQDGSPDVVVTPMNAGPWTLADDLADLTRPMAVVTTHPAFVPEALIPDPDPADWGFETDA